MGGSEPDIQIFTVQSSFTFANLIQFSSSGTIQLINHWEINLEDEHRAWIMNKAGSKISEHDNVKIGEDSNLRYHTTRTDGDRSAKR